MMRRLSFPRSWPTALLAALLVAGCVGKGKTTTNAPAKPGPVGPLANQEVRYRVTADFTPFYRNGPQQINGPDLSLKKGTDVMMIRHAFGYSKVRTFNPELIGFASTEDLRPLTTQELIALNPPVPSAPVQTASGKKSRAVVGEYSLPPGASAIEPLPEAPQNTSTPPPNNMFRY